MQHVINICLAVSEQVLFAASKQAASRLTTLGFTSFVPRIRGHICLDEGSSTKLGAALLSLRMAFTSKHAKQLADGTLWVKEAKLSCRGTPV